MDKMICAQCEHKMAPSYYYVIQEWAADELETEITLCSYRCMLRWIK